MKIRTFVIGVALALALFLFAKRQTEVAPHKSFRAVVDLTSSADSRAATGTGIDAPGRLIPGLWTVDEIPPERLIAPLVVLDVSANAGNNPDYEISVQDVVAWEQAYGQVPPGAVVVARTGSASPRKGAISFPGFSADAAKFLVEGRNAIALGIDTMLTDSGPSRQSATYQYALAHGLYLLKNVANLDRVPASGAIAMVAPAKLPGVSEGPVRLMALVW
jgi:kynurenine formamidase